MKFSLFFANLAMDKKEKAPYTTITTSVEYGAFQCLRGGALTCLLYLLRNSRSTQVSAYPTYRRVTNRGTSTGGKRTMSPRSTGVVLTEDINGMPRGLRAARRFLALPTIPLLPRRTGSNYKPLTSVECDSVLFANGGGR